MSLLYVDEIRFEDTSDPVETEFSVYRKIKSYENLLSRDTQYVAVPLAATINKKGISVTNNIIDAICRSSSKKKIFVCQHIHVNKLNFHGNVVYTPHAMIGEPHKVIPHFNPCIHKRDFMPWNKRCVDYSFLGAFKTHPLRSQLTKLKGNKIIIQDTGCWHFEKQNREKQTQAYVNMLCDTKYALCPPGTGVSTIRLYEAMAAGCTPVIFNDVKVPDVIEPYVVRIKNVDDVRSIEMIDNSETIHKIYWDKLSNDQLYKFIL